MPAKDESVEFRCSAAEKLMFEEAAAQDEMKLSSWFRALGHGRAMEILVPQAIKSTAFKPGYGITNNEED